MEGMEWKGRRVMSASLLMRVLAVLAGIWTVFEIFDVEDMALDLNMPEAMLAAGATTIFCVAGAALAGEGRIFRLEDGRPGISLATLRALKMCIRDRGAGCRPRHDRRCPLPAGILPRFH